MVPINTARVAMIHYFNFMALWPQLGANIKGGAQCFPLALPAVAVTQKPNTGNQDIE